eukprot:TRINITY_DN1745_c0_g1_i1.p1 TRINITY_DN1745_c0_g1~~TRINITY_DN1745_c0_g1_i1.p1  ORF type:complete len:455 (+),score=164.03 TRINITY_DN1745_c0_g1_i1:103-1467(+)
MNIIILLLIIVAVMYLFAKYFILPDANEPQLTADEYVYKPSPTTTTPSSSSVSANDKDDTTSVIFPSATATTTTTGLRARIIPEKEQVPVKHEAKQEDVVINKQELEPVIAIPTKQDELVVKEKVEKKPEVVPEKKVEEEEKDEEVEEEEDEDDDDDDDLDDDEEIDRKEITQSEAGPHGLLVAGVSLQGRRPDNEDRLVMVPTFSPTLGMYAVFDGHNGASASNYCQKRFAKLLKKSKAYPKDIKTALEQTFLEVDKRYIDTAEDAGTTALVALVHKQDEDDEGVIYVANAGDCRCVVSVYGHAKALSTDHKPDLPEEQERITAANHQVKTSVEMLRGARLKVARVDGELAVSRAIGDVSFKDESDKSPTQQAVTAFPEVTKTVMTGGHKFMVMACDGLWDVMTNIEVVEYVSEKLALVRDHSQLSEVALSLARRAVNELNSTDNVSVVIVKF